MQAAPKVGQGNRRNQELGSPAVDFYRHALELMNSKGLPYLVGGSYALEHFTGIARHSHDFDIFVCPEDYERVARGLREDGFHTELVHPHWLGKAFSGEDFIDIIFSGGNSEAVVDEEWFDSAPESSLFGVPTRLCPAEEILWSKAFVMERERFDGADIMHLLRSTADKLDWDRVFRRFGDKWRVLFAHVVLFGFVYPGERHKVPDQVVRALLARLSDEVDAGGTGERVCQGTLLSRAQYLVDVDYWSYADARLEPRGNMTCREIEHWTAQIDEK